MKRKENCKYFGISERNAIKQNKRRKNSIKNQKKVLATKKLEDKIKKLMTVKHEK